MSKRRHEEQELPFVALMDTMTNVVGVLIIVMVMVGISVASAVKKILSDLPPVTKEEHQQIVEQLKKIPPPPAKPEELEEKKKIAEQRLKKALDDLATIDVTSVESQMKFMDLESFRKQLDEAKKLREAQKAEVDKMLAEVNRLKALLDETPEYKPPAPKFVRLPNPRAYPEKPDETRVLVARQGVLTLHEGTFVKPILEGLDKVKSQLEYKDPKIDPFAAMLAKVYGSPQAAQQAWPEIAEFAGTFQMDQVALAHKALLDARLPATKAVLAALGDISIPTRSTMNVVAEAVIAATQGNLGKWTALDPSRDPLKPTIKATSAGNKISFTWGAKTEEVKAEPKEVLAYFVRDLGGMDGIKNGSRTRVIYDAFKLVAVLERAASNPGLTGSYVMKPNIRPGTALVQLALTPKPGGGETLEQMRAEGSSYQRLLRQIKGEPNGIAVFQVMKDAFDTYLEARKIADDIGVAANWDFLASLDININVTGYAVQKFTLPPPPAPPPPPGTAPAVRIAPPKKTLD